MLRDLILFNQDSIIKRINQYLQIKQRDAQLDTGHCHGLTLLWLQKMSEGNERWFYKTLQHIGLDDLENLNNEIEVDIEKFVQHICWLQSPYKYVKGVKQSDIDITLEAHIDYKISYQYDRRQLATVLEKVIPVNKMICLSALNHTIGVFRRENKYCIYDSNYIWGGAIAVEDERSLRVEIIDRLFRQTGLSIDKLPLHIIAFSNPSFSQSKKTKPPIDIDKLIAETKDLHKLGKMGVNSFYMACVNGNLEMVQKLLEKGANPNELYKTEKVSALSTAVSFNNKNLVKLLLENGAKVDLILGSKCTALHFAAYFGYEEIVKILLEKGANPLHKNEEGDTPLYTALENEQWETAAHILSQISSLKDIPRNDIRDLRECKEQILTAVHKLLPELPQDKSKHLIAMIREIYRREFNKEPSNNGISSLGIFSPIATITHVNPPCKVAKTKPSIHK